MPGLTLLSLIFTIGWTIAGLFLYYSSELYEAIREIAINTRKDSSETGKPQPRRSEYNGLLTLASLTKVFGVIIIVLAWLNFISGQVSTSRPGFF